MDQATPSQSILQRMANIDSKRRATQVRLGSGGASATAIVELHKLLDSEARAAQLPAAAGFHQANMQAIRSEIDRVQGLAGVEGQLTLPPRPHVSTREQIWRGPLASPHQVNRARRRRTMGRTGNG